MLHQNSLRSIENKLSAIEDSFSYGEHTSSIVRKLRIDIETLKSAKYSKDEAENIVFENDTLDGLNNDDFNFDSVRDLQNDIVDFFAQDK